jgi:hypothetical protein
MVHHGIPPYYLTGKNSLILVWYTLPSQQNIQILSGDGWHNLSGFSIESYLIWLKFKGNQEKSHKEWDLEAEYRFSEWEGITE